MDFVTGTARRRAEEFYLKFSKWCDGGVGGDSDLRRVPEPRQVMFVLNAAFTLRGLTSGALLGGLMLAVFWKNGRAVSSSSRAWSRRCW